MIPKNYGFWRFLLLEYKGKIYQPPELATGVSYFFEVGHSNQHLCKFSCFYHNLHYTAKIRD